MALPGTCIKTCSCFYIFTDLTMPEYSGTPTFPFSLPSMLAGILEEVFAALEQKVAGMQAEERHACVLMDEIQISPGLDYDASTGSIIGQPTIGPSNAATKEALATHALVFMLAGITSRWKQAVAYHFTSSSFDAEQVKQCLFNVIRRAESAGVTVSAVVTDMGPGNTAIWRLCGIHASKYGKPRTSCPHPCGNGRHLYFLADAPHLLKNLRGHLVRGQEIILDDATVKANSLPSSKVSMEHIRQACLLDDKHKLKVMPHLKYRDLDPNHFQKMNVASAHALMHHSTAAGLRYLVNKNLLPKEAITTAFFLDEVFRWFTIMTSRTRKTALSELCAQKAAEATNFLQAFIKMFLGLTIMDKAGMGKGAWKPIQTGAIISTLSALSLRQYYIAEKGFKFLLLSRLSQDALENLFSSIRFKTPVPRAREFKCTFRIIVLGQFSQPSRHGSYAIDDSQDLLHFFESKKEFLQPSTEDGEETCDDGIVELCEEEQDSLLYFAGYVAYAVTHKHKLCNVCRGSLVDRTKEVPELIALKCYVQHGHNPLKVPSQPLVDLATVCEQLFRVNEENLIESKCTLDSLKKAVQDKDVYKKFPACHSVAEKVTAHFFLCRLRFSLKQRNAQLLSKLRQSGKCASKSVGMRVLVQNVS